MQRFISPAVVSPDTIDIEIPKDNYAVLRRGLMVIAKIIQNLANNIFFGKEAHMTILNKFLEGNIANVTRFLSEMHVSSRISAIDTFFLLLRSRNSQLPTKTTMITGSA
jgi:hypothetical protein